MGWSEDTCVFRSYVSLTGPKRWHSCETHVRTFLFDEHIQWTTSIDNTKHRLTVWDQRRGPTRRQGQWGDFLWGQGGKTFFLKVKLHSAYTAGVRSVRCLLGALWYSAGLKPWERFVGIVWHLGKSTAESWTDTMFVLNLKLQPFSLA